MDVKIKYVGSGLGPCEVEVTGLDATSKEVEVRLPGSFDAYVRVSIKREKAAKVAAPPVVEAKPVETDPHAPGEFKIRLVNLQSNLNKIGAIKETRDLMGLGLGEAKYYVEGGFVEPRTARTTPARLYDFKNRMLDFGYHIEFTRVPT